MADGLKQSDLKPCTLCGKGVMHKGNVIFYRVSVQQFIIDMRAVQRQHGLEMHMGEATPLAQIMGPNEDLAKASSEPLAGLLCAPCAMKATPPLHIWSEIAEKEERAEEGLEDG